MNKEFFFKVCDDELNKRTKELPVLEDLSTTYHKQAFVLMIYAAFEGFVYKIATSFYDLLKTEQDKGKKINAHYSFCLNLYCKENIQDKKIKKVFWKYFSFFKKNAFKQENQSLIDTNDNLGYEAFKYILFLLNISEFSNIDTNFYSKTLKEAKEKTERNYYFYKDIINELLEKRNDIAHGNSKIFQENFLKQEKIKEMSNAILVVLRNLKANLIDIIDNEKYILDS